jgi:hypothetical protein
MRLDAHRQQQALIVALLASLLLWSLPFGGFVLYPFKLLSTWVHEMSHGLVMLLTGAGFSRLEIFRDTSGIAYAERTTAGPALAAIACAGYMGTSLLGSVLLILSQRWHRTRAILLCLGLALGLSLLLCVRNDFGQGVVAIGGIAFLVLSRFAPERVAVVLVNFIAAQACINAVLDIRVLFRPVMVVGGKVLQFSDANVMSAATFGPPWMWAVIWMLWSFAWFFGALRLTYLRRLAASEGPRREARPDRRRAAPPSGGDHGR